MRRLVGLLDPLRVGRFELSNRIVMPPMGLRLSTKRGEVTEGVIEHYSRRAEGLGLVIVEASYITLGGKVVEYQTGIHDDTLIPGLQRLASAIHSFGTPATIQIQHGGCLTKKEITGVEPVAPSSLDDHALAELHISATMPQPVSRSRELTIEEIEALTESFATAAHRAVKAGFDGVELHGAHAYLLNQFLSPLTNKRGDGYGGSLENRMRFPLDVVTKVRKKIDDRLLLYRLGVDHMLRYGFGLDEAKLFARKLSERGVDIIDVSGGLCGDRPPNLQDREGYFVSLAVEIKRVVDTPVIGVGGIVSAKFADDIVRNQQVDLVAVGRALLKDPDWAIKARVHLIGHC